MATEVYTQNLSMQLKTNLLWIAIVNIALVVLYLTVTSHKINSLDMNGYGQRNDTIIKQTKCDDSSDLLDTSRSEAETDAQKANVTSGDCEGLVFPVNLLSEEKWHPVNGNRTAVVFSVYLLQEKQKLVIIGAKIKDYTSYHCQLWYRKDNSRSIKIEQRTARVIALPEGHGKRYTATLFECLLRSSSIPDFLSVVSESCAQPLHLFAVKSNIVEDKTRVFTVCLSPLNHQYDSVHQLIEWIELNRILGAEKFIVYNHSSSNHIKRVLHYYSKRGLTEVIQWRNPEVDIMADIHYFGQIAALNDCLYRNKQRSEFVVNLDIDEFIIPHLDSTQTWSEILEQLYKIKQKASIVYLFRNAFFRMEWSNSKVSVANKTLIDQNRLITLSKFERENNIYPARVRSKYFARTSLVFRLMIHEVRGLSYTKLQAVPPRVGLLHHYRHCEDLSVSTGVRILDTTVMVKYHHILLNNVQNAWRELV